jgi:tetratricopeptide (TPR) repeat protein
MKRALWLVGGVVVVATIGAGLYALTRVPEATTSSPEALAEFSAAMEAEMKLYRAESIAHLERAIELDPDFVFAKIMLSDSILYTDPERSGRLLGEASAADRELLSPRERLYLERALAVREGRPDDAKAMVDAYIERYPDDPWVLNLKAVRAWGTGDHETADRLYRRLIELDPNWFIAYNMLGYLTMKQGKFGEAEEFFTTYRFVAPDQANPHDSLGELFIVLGRYQEAEETLRRALTIKPDFWSSYDHMVLLRILQHDVDGAREVIAQMSRMEGAPEGFLKRMECGLHFEELLYERAWQSILEDANNGCMELSDAAVWVGLAIHHAACKRGDWLRAEQIEARFEPADKGAESDDEHAKLKPSAVQQHLRGVRLALQGDLEAAEQNLRDADANLGYTNAGTGIYKLSNRLCLVEVLFAQGRDAEAHKLLTKVRTVNPELAQEFEDQGMHYLGLEGRRS